MSTRQMEKLVDCPRPTGVRLVTNDVHTGLVAAIGVTLPGAGWQRCRTHYAANLMATTPKSSWPWVRALLHSVYDQPYAVSLHAQFDQVLDAVGGSFRRLPRTSTPPPTCSRSPRSRRSYLSLNLRQY